MKPAPLDHVAPTSLREAIDLLSDPEREAVVLAGGQSLMPMLSLRLARPDVVVDLAHLEGLDHIRLDGRWLVMGAMATKRAVERSALVREHQPLWHAATLQIGHPQIRNRGTVGGSMAQADPAAEYPAAALVMGAELTAVGPDGERTIPVEEFFLGYLTTALGTGEILTEVRVPVLDPATGWAFLEITRRHGDFAIAGATVTLELDGAGRCRNPRVAVFGVGPTPSRAGPAEQAVDGQEPDAALFEAAGRAAAAAIDEPLSDVHASAEYRRHVLGVLIARALLQASARAGQGGAAA
ncbi:MAG: xanthine dehydrogenase family protein subunit M [Acidimicrobiia bacterium]